MCLRYLTVADVVETHTRTIDLSGGGLQGVLHEGRIDSILAHMQNDDYYPTVADKLTHLLFGLATGHCFVDGNKRIAITATVQMLTNNGYMAVVARFMADMENTIVFVAKDVIGRGLLLDIVQSHLNLDSDNEDIKLRVFEAISNAPGSEPEEA
jgi:death-on-curing protein